MFSINELRSSASDATAMVEIEVEKSNFYSQPLNKKIEK